MSWSTIREADTEDYENLEKQAVLFAKRNGLDLSSYDGITKYPATNTIEFECDDKIHNENYYYLRQKWHAVVRRLFEHKHAEGIKCNYIGYSLD
ncbi:unnamed protein product [marine sediment metagenome]|uniref:Uncharacterized protein n=1 Tax=marine sediment metagenome TaxID=412755 RepID=X1DDM3_9ZZZZ